jgi:DNA-binding PadR family transcriptional regulator
LEIDRVQLVILSLLEKKHATTPGSGMTLREIYNVLNEQGNFGCAQITLSRKVWKLRDLGYVTSKMKSNKADMFYITEKGKEIRRVLFNEE